MDNKNIFDKKKFSGKKSVYYIIMGICVVVIGAASFISYKSVQNALSNKKLENTPNAVDKVDSPVDNVSKTETDNKPAQDADSQTQTDEKTEAVNTRPSDEPVIDTKAYVMPVSGEMTTGFSITAPIYSETLKDWRIHDGIDISAALGDNVVAVNDGAVEKINSDDIYGITVVIKHTDGRRSTYCNLEDSVELEEGQLIKQGDIVGKVGNTAVFEISDGPHLHFEMSENGNKIDPLSVIKE